MREVTRSRVPLMVSALVHVAAVLFVFTLSVPRQFPAPALRVRPVTLLAPVRPAVRVAAPMLLEIPRTQHRRFYTPGRAAADVPQRGLVLAPEIDIPPPLLTSPEFHAMAVLAAPPLRTDNLTAASAVVPVAAAGAGVRLAGFSGDTATTQRPAGTLRRAGFESASTADPTASPRLLAPAAFGDATVTAGPSLTARAAVSPVVRPVEILSKPKPVYTVEARGRRIEGEVLLQVLFAASGQVRVLGIVRGLGYGLDENAVAAAEAIRYRPAERAGMAADSTTVVHIVFQLAY